MGLTSVALVSGVAPTVTGGTAFTLTPDGAVTSGGVHVSDAAVADARIRVNATFKTKPASLLDASKNSWSKGYRTAVYCRPKVLTNGSIVFPLVRIQVEDHPEMSLTEVNALLNESAQLFFAASTIAFMRTGSLG